MVAAFLWEGEIMKDIIERYGFKLDKKGFMKCPFHKEKDNSFKVYPDGRGWFCFGCGEGGNATTFIARIEGISTKEAYEKIRGNKVYTQAERRKFAYLKQQEERFKLWEKNTFLQFATIFRYLDNLPKLDSVRIRYIDQYEDLCNFFITASDDEKLEFYKNQYRKEVEKLERISREFVGYRV